MNPTHQTCDNSHRYIHMNYPNLITQAGKHDKTTSKIELLPGKKLLTLSFIKQGCGWDSNKENILY